MIDLDVIFVYNIEQLPIDFAHFKHNQDDTKRQQRVSGKTISLPITNLASVLSDLFSCGVGNNRPVIFQDS